eukprot:scaffold1840_cov137-Skeletonema_dohrnii-CCMP3373.AAC.4
MLSWCLAVNDSTTAAIGGAAVLDVSRYSDVDSSINSRLILTTSLQYSISMHVIVIDIDIEVALALDCRHNAVICSMLHSLRIGDKALTAASIAIASENK